MDASDQSQLTLAGLVGVSGFVGATLRYHVSVAIPGLGGTLVVNTLGSFLLGSFLYVAMYSERFGPTTRAMISTGLLGSFTTYSTFAVGTATTTPFLAVGNVAATYGLGIAGVLVGRRLAGVVRKRTSSDGVSAW